MNWDQLAAPFAAEDIRHRKGPGGKQLPYVTNRAIQDRLDKVVGPGNWKNEYKEWGIGSPGVLCGLSIRIEDEWVTKWDGAEQTDIEAVKGGLSDAMKRAAVQWGIGRYLYQSENVEAGAARHSDESGSTGGSAGKAPAQHSVPVQQAYAPSEKQIAFYRRLVDAPVFTPEEKKRALEWLETKATRQTIKDQIDWLKRQVDTRKPVSA